MSKKIKYKIVEMEAVVQLTSNGYYVHGASVTTELWKRTLGALQGRSALIDAQHTKTMGEVLSKDDVVVFNKALVDRSYIIERVFSRSLEYHDSASVIINRHVTEWLVAQHKLPRKFTVLYDHGLEHPRNTAGGSQVCSLLENVDIRTLYRRNRIISDRNGQVQKEIWSLR